MPARIPNWYDLPPVVGLPPLLPTEEEQDPFALPPSTQVDFSAPPVVEPSYISTPRPEPAPVPPQPQPEYEPLPYRPAQPVPIPMPRPPGMASYEHQDDHNDLPLPFSGGYQAGDAYGTPDAGRGLWSRGFHQGQDYIPERDEVVSPVAGVVESAGPQGTYGNAVKVKFGDKAVLYAHLSRVDVRPGQAVDAGTQLGLVGSTGTSTGRHLHEEYFDATGKSIDPRTARRGQGTPTPTPTGPTTPTPLRPTQEMVDEGLAAIERQGGGLVQRGIAAGAGWAAGAVGNIRDWALEPTTSRPQFSAEPGATEVLGLKPDESAAAEFVRGRRPLRPGASQEEVDAAFKAFEDQLPFMMLDVEGGIGGPRPRGRPLPGGAQERGLTQRLRTTPDLVSPEIKQALDNEILTYEELGNQVAHDQARQRILQNPTAARERALRIGGVPDPITIAENIQLMQAAGAAGNIPEWMTLGRALATKGTIRGQEIQLFKTAERMGPDGLALELNKTIRAINESGGGVPTPAAKKIAQQKAQEVEVGAVRQKTQKQLAAIDAVRARSAQKAVRTVQESVEKQAPIKYTDFLKDMQRILKSPFEQLNVSLVPLVRRLRPMRVSQYEMGPADSSRFLGKAQEIQQITDPAAREAAQKALFAEMDAFVKAEVSGVNAERKAQQVLQREIARIDAAEARANSVDARLREIARIEQQEARGEDAATRGQMSETAAIERAEAGEVRAAEKAQRDAEKAALLEEQRATREAERAQAQEETAAARGERSAVQQAERQQRAGESLEAQRVRTQERAQESLAGQEGRAYERQNLQAAEDLAYLTEPEYRAARKQVLDAERQQIGQIKRTVYAVAPELGVPENVAQNFLERSRQIAAIPDGMQKERLWESLLLDVRNLVPPTKWDTAKSILDIPRASQTAWDWSYPFRQGRATAIRHPKIFASLWEPMFKAGWDPEFARLQMDRLAQRPMANIGHWSGLEFPEFNRAPSSGEELFGNRILGKVPGYKGSDRAYVMASNTQRTGLFDNFVQNWFPKGTDFSQITSIEQAAEMSGKSVQDFQNAARLMNALTGRGSTGWLKTFVSSKLMGNLIYAPKWLVSKVEPYEIMLNPMNTASLQIRREAAENLVAAHATVASLVAFGAFAGLWDTEKDPRSVHFGDVRFKGTDTWHDLTGGAGPILRLLSQMIPTPNDKGEMGNWIRTSSGDLVPANTGTAIGRFARSQLAPIPGTFSDFMLTQADPIGRSRDITNPSDVANAFYHMIGPLSWKDIVEAGWNYGLADGLISTPAIFGDTTQTYTTLRDVQNKATEAGDYTIMAGPAKGAKVEKYEDLDTGQRRQVNADPTVKAEVTRIETGAQRDIRKEIGTLFDQYGKSKEWLETGDPSKVDGAGQRQDFGLRGYLDSGMPPGKALGDRIKEFKAERVTLANGIMGGADMAEYLKTKGQKDVKIEDALAELYYGAEPTEDKTTGEWDFAPMDQRRAEVLAMADANLVDRNYITGTGENTFRGTRFTDPKVRAAVEEYERDMDALRPYYNIKNQWASLPAVGAALTAVDSVGGKTAYVAQARLLPPGPALDQAIDVLKLYDTVTASIDEEKQQTRRAGGGVIDKAGVKWGKWKPLAQETGGRPERPERPLYRPERPERPLAGVR